MKIISEVHVDLKPNSEENTIHKTEFQFYTTSDRDIQGRIDVFICHESTTTLENVGLQVWNGAFLMIDFLLSAKEMIGNSCLLELGSGTGIVAAVIGPLVKTIFVTDFSDQVLNMCHLNTQACHQVKLRKLDLKGALPFDGLTLSDVSEKESIEHDIEELNRVNKKHDISKQKDPYSWTKEDIDLWNLQGEIILVSDLIYDNELTLPFIRCMFQLLSPKRGIQRSLFLSLEKRIVFTIDKGVCAPAYDFFFEKLQELNQDHFDKNGESIEFVSIDVDSIPVLLETKTQRSEYVELWRFRMVKVGHKDLVNVL